MSTGKQTRVVAFVDDIFFASKIRQAAKAGGLELDVISDSKSIPVSMINDAPRLLIFDLNSKKLNPFDLIQKIKAAPELKESYCIGYFPHVEKDLKKLAMDAGFDEVMPRSRFSTELVSILKEYGNP
jgi:PleD family two-component response regulator